MSISIMARVFWTKYENVFYVEKGKRKINVSEPAAKVTMLAIADSADDFGENSHNSFDTLADKTGLKRRSVIRVARALIAHEYLSVTGLSNYGTNDFKVNLDKLGELPKRRARTGRPKSGDTVSLLSQGIYESSDMESKSGDSESQSSDRMSPDSALSVFKPLKDLTPEKTAEKRPLGTRRTDAKKKGDAIDWLLGSSEDIERQRLIVDMQHRFERASRINPPWENHIEGWPDFLTFLLEQDKQGMSIEAWYKWYLSDEFRRKSNVWIKPDSIKKIWLQAFPEQPTAPEVTLSPFELMLRKKQQASV